MAKKKNLRIVKKQELKKLLNQKIASRTVVDTDESISSDIEKFGETPLLNRADVFSKNNIQKNRVGTPMAGEERKQQLIRMVEGWNSMKNVDDFCVVLNIAWQVMYGLDAAKTSVDKLKRLVRKGRYVTFKIPKKKKGEFRTIDAPCYELKSVQQALNFVLQEIYTPNVAAMGFVRGKSVVTNAKMHLCQNFVYNIDLKDFFPSITSGRLFKRLLVTPFNLKQEIAGLIGDLCCHKKGDHKVLPQGAPTSPTITNIICEKLDYKLSRLAKAYGLKYTRYADDITFSGMKNVFAEDGKFCVSMRNIIEKEEGFKINTEKTRLCHRRMRQEVTGLTVNSKINVSRKYIKQLRPLLHNWEQKGYAEAQSIFAKHYSENNIKYLKFKGEHRIEKIILGKLMYLKMVKGESDSTYKSFSKQFEKLCIDTFGENGWKSRNFLTTSCGDGNILSVLDELANLIEKNTYE